jgi:group II intron reverse transcriptase/maturase
MTDRLRGVETIDDAARAQKMSVLRVRRHRVRSTSTHNLIEWEPNTDWRQECGTGGSPKGSNSYGDGRSIVPDCMRKSRYRALTLLQGKGRRLYSTSNDFSLDKNSGLKKLEVLRRENALHITKLNTNLYELILDYDMHATAYQKIKSNAGAMTEGVTPETLDAISRKELEKTIQSLKDHTFQFKPARREYIPKANGKLRPLGIPSPRDKIVQQVMVMILEAIFEGGFSEESHGFRPNRGVHTALKNISTWKSIEWLIEGDIQSYFDTINHQKLEALLKKRIKDQQFIDLYWKAVKAGYVEVKENKKIDSLIGTPQGSVLSPILANVYLHELDSFMTKVCWESQQTGASSRPSTKYLQLHSKIHTIYRKMNRGVILTQDQQVELRRLITERGSIPSTLRGPGHRIYYVRYADDFLIGVNGSLAITEQLKLTINDLLARELLLTMSLEKTKITGAKGKDKVMFLGTHIHRPNSRTYNQKVIKKRAQGRNFSSRIPASRLALLIPVKRIVDKLVNQNFAEIKQDQIKPKAKTSWINLPLNEIITRYNSVLRGFNNFYSFADNRMRLWLVQFILHHSCALLFKRKLNMTSRASVFKRFGRTLKVEYDTAKGKKEASLLKIKTFRAIRKFTVEPREPLAVVYYGLRSRSSLDKACVICNSTENIEMHHVKALKGKVSGFKSVMKAMNRKQIPVCKSCHKKIHLGTYDGFSLKFKDVKPPKQPKK